MLRAAVSSDIDTLESLYGSVVAPPGGYTGDELRAGLEVFCRFLEPYGTRATLFMVGRDFLRTANVPAIKSASAAGHEIANHTFSHAQGFRWLPPADKEAEIAGMEDACQAALGVRPIGFRSPGWNIGDDALPILQRRGYRYDSSVFPTTLSPVLKGLHRYATRARPPIERTTLGPWRHMFAPVVPYRADCVTLMRRGSGLIEFPVTVTPLLRWPFFATFLLSTGFDLFRVSYRALRALRRPIQYQFHLSDFVDFTTGRLASQVPGPRAGVYVAQSLRTPLARKLDLFTRAMDVIAEDYAFATLGQWADAGAAAV